MDLLIKTSSTRIFLVLFFPLIYFLLLQRVIPVTVQEEILEFLLIQLEKGLLLSCDIQLILGETRREILSLAVQEEYYTHQICAICRELLSCDKQLILGETGRQVKLREKRTSSIRPCFETIFIPATLSYSGS